MIMKTLAKIILGIVLFSGFTTTVLAQNNQNQKKSDPECKLLGVVFYADWCPNCKAIAPSVMNLQEKLKDKPVTFLTFNFTNDETKVKSKEVAKQMGLTEVLENNRGTGYVLLLDPVSKKELGKLTKAQTADEMYTEVTQLIK